MKNKKGNIKIISIIILLVAISVGVLGYMFSKINQSPNINKQSIAVSDLKSNKSACAQDAKLCPDGSYVSRAGSNCEFAECPIAKNELSLINLISEIDKKFIKQLNKSVEYDNSASVKWIREDGKVICLNHISNGLSFGENVGIAKAVRNKIDNDISAYLKSLGFVENEKNTKRGQNEAGTIGFEKNDLKCKMSSYASDENSFNYQINCAKYTKEDQGIFDEFFPLMYKKEYPTNFFCLGKIEDNYVIGNSSGLDENDGLAYAGANVFGIKEDGKWEIVISQDILECSFAKRFPKSINPYEKCWDEDKGEEISL